MRAGIGGGQMENNHNLICCICKEHIDFLEQLPERERFEIFYKVILSAFNQNDSITVSNTISDLGKSAFNLLKKNIACKKVSANYGGKRPNAGRKPTVIKPQITEPEVFDPEIVVPANKFISLTDNLEVRTALGNPDSAISVFLETGTRYDELSTAEREFVDRADVREKCAWHKEIQAATKEIKKKPFTPPTIEEWLDFCREKNLNLGKMRNAYDGYVAANWHDTKGNPIRNWKQKILMVWMQNSENYNKQSARFPQKSGIAELMAGSEMAKQMLKERGLL